MAETANYSEAVLEEGRVWLRRALEDDIVLGRFLSNVFATQAGELPKLMAHNRRIAFDHDAAEIRALWEKYKDEPLHTRWVEIVAKCVALEATWEGNAPRRPDFVAIVQRWLDVDKDTAWQLVDLATTFEHGARFQRYWIALVTCRAIGLRKQIEEAGL